MSYDVVEQSTSRKRTPPRRAAMGLALIAVVGAAISVGIHYLKSRQPVEPWAPLLTPREITATSVAEASSGTKLRSAEYCKRVLAVHPKHFANILHRWRLEAANRKWSANPKLRSEMDALLAQKKTAGKLAGADLFVLGPSGWRVRQSFSLTAGVWLQGEHHVDQFLACCAEVGVPSDWAVETSEGPVTIVDLLRSSRLDFVEDQEIAWSVVAYCLYLPFNSQWKNRFGEHHSYARIANKMMDRSLSEGNCWGTHRLYALSVILQADRETRFLPDSVRERIHKHLAKTSARLAANQEQNGAWRPDWENAQSDNTNVVRTIPRVDQMISVTAHHLEWLAVAPREVRPSASSLEAAMEFLLRACESRNSFDIDRRYCPFSHAARGLLLLSGAKPTSG